MKRNVCVFLLVLFALSALFAAGQGGSTGAGGGQPASTTPVGSYPIKTDVALDYWLSLNTNVSPNYSNLGETPFAKGLQERTGVKINYLHPPTGSTAAQEQLNLMIAAGEDLPDVIEWNWVTTYPGGPQKAIDDGVILNLNDVINKYAPNLKAFLQANPNYDRMVKTDDGNYYVFPFIRGHDKLLYSQGLEIRKDWLDELNLAPPTTIDEWYTVLKAFKEKKNCSAPFTQVWSNNQRMFVESFGVLKGFYIGANDGQIHFGQIDPGYRDWMSTMAQWYKEGLIDPDIASIQTSQQNQKMTAGTAGATVASVGSGMGTWTNSVRPTNPKYELMALASPDRAKGQKRVYGLPNQPYSGQDSAAITANSKNVELAARYLDWGYSQEGHLYYNFGIEGESYTMVNGKPIYTPQIMNNSKGWPLSQSMSAYVRSTGAGPFIQNEGYIEQYYALPEQRQALINYNTPGAINYLMPPITPSQTESRELATIMNDINTYVDEMMVKFILGNEVLNDSSWNTYVSTIKRMGIDRALEIEKAALDRYRKR
ncbi:MAG: extracellular solute-binding protein [Treponema sp.]|jgi:putative aldouronate transport system substrate-binding protein|nr:extracellular solute-binding protein [Treponema sp.]